ncbi:Ribonuclease H2 subunit B [Lamellibrachia satsuma]|nr:Ribonuclease H2 subunit B [Lamellibrachia satsuma]
MPRKNDRAAGNNEDDKLSCVMLTDESVFTENGDVKNQPTFCELSHPKTEQPSLFLFTNGDSKVFEVLQLKEEFRSWFIGETVHQEGGLVVSTPVDVVFLLLPYLMKGRAQTDNKFMLLEHLVHDDDFPECTRLCRCDGASELSCVADVREADDDTLYRFNKDKTISWLRLKVEQVASHLEENRVNVGTGSHDASFRKSKLVQPSDHDDYVRYAHGLVSEYLPTCLSTDLKDFMEIKDIVHEKPTLEEPVSKRARVDGASPTKPLEDYSKGVLGAKLVSLHQIGRSWGGVKMTAAQKKLTRVDRAGMKNIASFFSQKNTKKKA